MTTCGFGPLYKRLEEIVGVVEAHSYYNRYNGDISHIEGLSDVEVRQTSEGIDHNRHHTLPLDHLKVVLEERLRKLKNSKSSNKLFLENQVKRQQEKIKGIDAVIGVASVIDYLYDEAIGEGDAPTGYVSKMDNFLSGVRSAMEKYDSLGKKDQKRLLIETSEKLQTFYDYAESLEHLEDYRGMYKESVAKGVKPAVGSTMDKLNQLLVAKDNLKAAYKEAILPIVSKTLSGQISEAANESAKKEYDQRKEYLAKKQKEGKDVSKEIVSNLEKFQRAYVTEETLLRDLQSVTRDVPYMDKMFGYMIGLGDTTLSTFAKFVKRGFFDVKQELESWKKDVSVEYKEFIKSVGHRDSPHKANSEIVEVIVSYDREGNEIRKNAFVQEIDWSAYNKAKRTAQIEAERLGDKLGGKYMSKWYKENTEPLHKEDRVDYGRAVKGINSMVTEMEDRLSKKHISQEEFDNWIIQNMYNEKVYRSHDMGNKKETEDGGVLFVRDRTDYAAELLNVHKEGKDLIQYRRELSVPKKSKFPSSKYSKMSEASKKYHAYMLEQYFKSQERLPDNKQLGYVLPYRYKTKRELLSEGRVVDAVKTAKEEAFKVRKDDADYGDPSGKKVNPIYYTAYIPAEESSLDVFESIVEFEKMSKMYEKVGEMEPISNAFRILIEDRDTLHSEGGKNMVNKVASALGIDDWVKKDGKSNASDMVDWFIEQQLYDEMNLEEMVHTPFGTIDVGKTVGTMQSVAALSMLGGPELLKSFANTVQAKLQKKIEGAAKEYVSDTDLVYGEKQFGKHMKSILNDFAQPVSVSLEGQWLDLVDFIQGTYMDEFGKNISGSSLKKLATSGTWMFTNNASEYQTQASMAFALSNTVKLKDSTGASINLKDAYTLGEDGKIVLKDGVTKENGEEWTADDLFDFTNRLHGVNKLMHGVYNSFDRPLIKRWTLGRLLLMFKGFLVPTVKKRFKEYGSNQELGGVTEGFYRTFYRKMWEERGNLISILRNKEGLLTDMESANVRRAVTELSLVILLSAGAVLMAGLADDDEDLKRNWGYQFALYQMTRASSELRFYQPGFGLGDQMRLFTSPSAMNGAAERFYRTAYQTVGYSGDDGWAFNDTYKRAEGMYEKGDSKLLARWFTLLGFNGNNASPAQATEIFHKL